ncbi:MAG: sigma 54-interacting transcriptional regulator [Candidatus Krumholzibacteria bacterium]|nr:sigma 54-interacting transcriptional regulator [Candidatus Krumholzibacteria bacterium]
MPDSPEGNDSFEYEKKQHGHKYKSAGSEEELGDMHLSTENYSVALEYYEKALRKVQAEGPSADLVRLYQKISDCYRKKGMLREAMSFLDSAASHCEEEDAIGRGTIACRRGIITYDRGDIKRALREACSAYRALRTSDEHHEVANTQLLIANCYARLRRQDEAEQYFLDALSSYRRIGDMVGESYVLNNLGLFHKDACRWGRDLQFLGRALEICDEVGLTQHRVRVSLNMGIVHLKKREFASAESSFCAARDMARRIGDDLKYTRATLMLGVKETRIGNLLSAEKHLLEARVLAERRSYLREIALADEFIGDLMFEKGDLEGAVENYTISLKSALAHNSEGDIVAEVQRRMMQVFLARRQADEVLSLGEKALKTCAKCGEMHEVGYVERLIGQALAIQGGEDEAQKRINGSITTFLSMNNPYEAHRSGMILGELLLRNEDRRSGVLARKLVAETIPFFERTEEYPDLAAGHFLLSRIEEVLGNRDECLLHLYDAQRLAEELRDRNLLRRIRRMRRKVESTAAGSETQAAGGERRTDAMGGAYIHDPQLRSYLDYILHDLMRRLTAGHGFVALGNGRGSDALVLARRGLGEQQAGRITAWMLARSGADAAERFLVTDAANDRRVREIVGDLPGGSAPAYFHPLCRDGAPIGLLFFQSEKTSGVSPVGSIFEVVSTYAGFIEFLIRGTASGMAADTADAGREGFTEVITCSERMFRVIDLAGRVASSDSTVLLMGETGTGKGLIAEAIHGMSRRRAGKFVHVNCAALPETLLESELFGHVKGSFTSAVSDKKGLLAEADGGTIFLDEIGKAPLPIQGKLLQFLDTSKIRPIGSNEMRSVDVRIIFASKVDLLRLCREGRMLEDFYYRINDFPLTIPPLRERPEDIPLLARHYLERCCATMEKKTMGFSDEAMESLRGYGWPGNVRELGKIIKRAVILAEENSVITPALLFSDPAGRDPGSGQPDGSLPEMVRDLERRLVDKALEKSAWNRKAAAAELGISYPTLLKKIRDFDLRRPD